MTLGFVRLIFMLKIFKKCDWDNKSAIIKVINDRVSLNLTIMLAIFVKWPIYPFRWKPGLDSSLAFSSHAFMTRSTSRQLVYNCGEKIIYKYRFSKIIFFAIKKKSRSISSFSLHRFYTEIVTKRFTYICFSFVSHVKKNKSKQIFLSKVQCRK